MAKGLYTVERRRNSRYTAGLMAKAKRNKVESVGPEGGAKSLLEVAWRAFESGDSVLTRRAVKLLLAGGPLEADEALAKKLGRQLFGAVPEGDAQLLRKQVATELAARTKTAPKPYLFALMTAAIWLLMIALAHRS